MEAIKPLVVLVLLGTILYGAYSVVQKGHGQSDPSSAFPSAGLIAGGSAPAASGGPTDAPPFAPPQVDFAAQSAAVTPAQPAAVTPAQPAAMSSAQPAPMFPAQSAALAPAEGPPPFSSSVNSSSPLASSAGGTLPVAAAGTAIAAAGLSAAMAPATAPPAAEPATTYLSAMSAPPPGLEQQKPLETSLPGPDPLAAPASLPPETAAARTSPIRPQSTAFASAWADAHEKLAAGRYAEALAVLSVWYDDTSLGLEESQRLEELLGQLAGTVIYSQQDLLLPPHIVGPQDALPAIAAQLSVPWQLLAKINGIEDPARLVEGEPLKLVRGPFDAVVGVSRRRLSLQVGGNYAGSFPIVVGRQIQERVGASLAVVDVRRGGVPAGQAAATQVSFVAAGQPAILLGDGMTIEAVDDPAALGDTAPASSLIIAARDLREIVDILGPGSHVLIRQ